MKVMSKETRMYLKNGTSNLNATIEYKFTFSLTPDVRKHRCVSCVSQQNETIRCEPTPPVDCSESAYR